MNRQEFVCQMIIALAGNPHPPLVSWWGYVQGYADTIFGKPAKDEPLPIIEKGDSKIDPHDQKKYSDFLALLPEMVTAESVFGAIMRDTLGDGVEIPQWVNQPAMVVDRYTRIAQYLQLGIAARS